MDSSLKKKTDYRDMRRTAFDNSIAVSAVGCHRGSNCGFAYRII